MKTAILARIRINTNPESVNGLCLFAESVSTTEERELWAFCDPEIPENYFAGMSCGAVVRILMDTSPGDEASYLAEAAEQLYRQRFPQILLASNTPLGDGIAANLGFLLDQKAILHVSSLSGTPAELQLTRSAYGMNLKLDIQVQSYPLIASAMHNNSGLNPESLPAETAVSVSSRYTEWLHDIQDTPAAATEGLTSARIVLAAGRGVGSLENTEKLKTLAEKMGACLGGSRPVVFDGWLPHECLIGASGNILAPEKCLIFGASGAAAFATGIEKSGIIAAINEDPDAAIFHLCDYGIVGDCNEAAELLLRHLQ